MAKKKKYEVPQPKNNAFDGIVDESFNEGYESEPEIDSPATQEKPTKEAPPVATKPLSEKERFLRDILAGDKDAISRAWKEEERYTFYVSAMLRACIDIVSYNEGCTKTKVIEEAFENFFSQEVKEAAKERAVAMAVKTLQKKIKEENEKTSN